MTSRTHPPDSENGFSPEIRRARMQTLTIYEVSESELHILEHGAPDSIYFSIALLLFSCAATSLIALLTCEFASNKVVTGFLVATIAGFIVGFVLLGLWLRSRKRSSDVIAVIRDRLPPEGISKIIKSE